MQVKKKPVSFAVAFATHPKRTPGMFERRPPKPVLNFAREARDLRLLISRVQAEAAELRQSIALLTSRRAQMRRA